MKFKRSVNTEVRIDLTSLIDVVFIVLLFYVLSTTFYREGTIHINLPEAKGNALDQKDLRIEIVIAKNGTYKVNGHDLPDNKVDTVMKAVSDIAGTDNTIPITITADADTTHQSVVTAMDAVARLGFSKLNIATRQSEGGP
ncbi:MAG TPA: biopolymer transporter ExbD [Candidatus Acidoferrum sp.]|nr:biopolymer transporter ExbD [Candidatus Acidoferrum sp.]